MYQDPTKIRQHVVKLRFSEEEHRLIQAYTDYTGEQKAALLRDIVLEQAMETLAPGCGTNEVALLSRLRA